MSEEEILQGIDNIKHHFFKDIKEQYYIEVINALLDLYNKEKEKNKELEEGLKYRVNYCKLLEKELYSNGINYDMELTKIEEKYLQELLEGDERDGI